MADSSKIKEHMEVMGARRHVGTVYRSKANHGGVWQKKTAGRLAQVSHPTFRSASLPA